MSRRSIVGLGMALVVLAAVPLSGCSSVGFPGTSTYGSAKLEIADIKDIGDYTPDRALSEARSHFRNSDFGYSASLYKRAVELQPKQPEGYIGLAASYDRLGRFDLSDRVYASLYEITGGTAQYYNNVGYSYMLRGNLTSALENFRKASRLAPNNVVIANNLQILAKTAADRRA